MDPAIVKARLIEVLRRIQELGGFEDKDHISGDTVPLKDLKDFDTQVAPVAITLLAKALAVSIPNEENLFLSPDGQKRLTVDQVVERTVRVVQLGDRSR